MRLFPLLLALLLCSSLACAERNGRVSWVYDGDTLLVEGVGKVRLLGIDAPEFKGSQRDLFYLRNFGIPPERLRRIARLATKFNIRQAKGKRLRLESERQERDRHGRLLAYAYLPDGRLLNLLLLKNGLATVFRRYDFASKDRFLAEEAAARTAKAGLWQD